MPDKNEDMYPLLKLPLVAGNYASSRKKRLYASAVQEYVGFKSRELQQEGYWSIDPTTGDYINAKGQNIIEDLEFTINDPTNPRSHWEIPEAPIEEAEKIAKIWTERLATGKPDMTARSRRYQELLDYHKSPKLAGIAFTEEAAGFNVTKPFSDQVGTTGDVVRDDGKKSGGGPNNPWGPEWAKRHTPDETLAEQTRLIRISSERARSVAKAAGVSVFGVPLKK
jgi:hypothetical protein